MLLIFGELPTQAQLAEFRRILTEHEFIHEDMRNHFEGFPPNGPPMAILSAMINAMGCFQQRWLLPDEGCAFHGGGRTPHEQGPHDRGCGVQEVHRPAAGSIPRYDLPTWPTSCT